MENPVSKRRYRLPFIKKTLSEQKQLTLLEYTNKFSEEPNNVRR